MLRLYTTLNVFDYEVGAILDGSIQYHHYANVSFSPSGGTQNSRQLPKGLFGETSSNVIRSHPLQNHSIL